MITTEERGEEVPTPAVVRCRECGSNNISEVYDAWAEITSQTDPPTWELVYGRLVMCDPNPPELQFTSDKVDHYECNDCGEDLRRDQLIVQPYEELPEEKPQTLQEQILGALEGAEHFLVGFEDAETQEGVGALLAKLREAQKLVAGGSL